MRDYYLKFTDKADWESKATAAGVRTTSKDTEGNDVVTYTIDGAIDIVGTVYNNDATYNEDFTINTPSTSKDGYHVNLRLNTKFSGSTTDSDGKEILTDVTLPSEFSSNVVTPSSPYQVFA
tara:strand:- start:542 stop:904 length:363 start_codon:yes stop_codon:yes gene_type:complete